MLLALSADQGAILSETGLPKKKLCLSGSAQIRCMVEAADSWKV